MAAGISLSRLDRWRAAVRPHADAARASSEAEEAPREAGIASAAAGSPAADALAKVLRGDWHETPYGPAFVRDDWFPLDHRYGRLPLSSALAALPEALGRLAAPVSATVTPHRLAFFDIETTGLAGGTGTYVVLAGLGSYEDGAFRLRQYFLADIGHEEAMLRMLADDLARFEGVVTYNGRAFDVPFVETRLALARIPSPCRALGHVDLLHAVRRLYRHRMPGCRLAEAERRLLRVERPDDIPGWLIPQLYFDYVRAGRAAPLRGVFRHNAEDVLALVGVLAAVARLVAGEGDMVPEDAAAVARFWEAAGEPERALPLYRGALPWLVGGDDWAWAASRHAALCKRRGLRAEAVPLWETLWQGGDAAAGLELAKHHEHRSRDLASAVRITQMLLERTPAEAGELERRLARLRRKMTAFSQGRHERRTA